MAAARPMSREVRLPPGGDSHVTPALKIQARRPDVAARRGALQDADR